MGLFESKHPALPKSVRGKVRTTWWSNQLTSLSDGFVLGRVYETDEKRGATVHGRVLRRPWLQVTVNIENGQLPFYVPMPLRGPEGLPTVEIDLSKPTTVIPVYDHKVTPRMSHSKTQKTVRLSPAVFSGNFSIGYETTDLRRSGPYGVEWETVERTLTGNAHYKLIY